MNNHKYAKILFDLCKKANNISKIHAQLKLVAYLFNKVPAFRLVIITKRLKNDDKINIIEKSLYHFDLTVIEFVTIIIKNNRPKILLSGLWKDILEEPKALAVKATCVVILLSLSTMRL